MENIKVDLSTGIISSSSAINMLTVRQSEISITELEIIGAEFESGYLLSIEDSSLELKNSEINQL